jgi:hypothetical protein
MKLQDLRKEIPYKWRTGPGNTQLAYIDARDVMDLLDEVVGPENWQDSYELVGDKIIAGVGILANDQWVWKYDTGTESNIEEEKGMFSDAFKRAAVKWGVGRFLYDLKPKKEPWTSLSYTHAKEKAKEEIDDLVLTEEMLGGEEEVESCPVCGGRISKKEIDYCKSKGLPPACYECQKGTKIGSKTPKLNKVYASERKTK